jgi:hypothetical protein
MNIVLILPILEGWVDHFSIDILKEIKPDFTSMVETVDDYYIGEKIASCLEGARY